MDAEAERMGGGKSVGQQSSNVTQRESAGGAPSQGGAATNSAAAAKPATPAAAPAAAAPKRPLGAMLGGLAAGLGLAWLASSLGLGAGFAQFLLIALLALAVVAVIGMVMRARRSGAASQSGASPFAFQGAGCFQPCGSAGASRLIALKTSATTHRLARGSAAAWRLTLRAKPRVRAW